MVRTDPGPMSEEEREGYLANLDETLFKGMSVQVSVGAHFLILDSDLAFVKGAYLSALITAISSIETQLRFDHSEPGKRLGLAELIDQSRFSPELKSELHELRRYRNKLVHVSDPWDECIRQSKRGIDKGIVIEKPRQRV